MPSTIATASSFLSVFALALTVIVEDDTDVFVMAAVAGVVDLGVGVSFVLEAAFFFHSLPSPPPPLPLPPRPGQLRPSSTPSSVPY
jgi:hypothetical protein